MNQAELGERHEECWGEVYGRRDPKCGLQQRGVNGRAMCGRKQQPLGEWITAQVVNAVDPGQLGLLGDDEEEILAGQTSHGGEWIAGDEDLRQHVRGWARCQRGAWDERAIAADPALGCEVHASLTASAMP